MKLVILDRDGVINYDSDNYIKTVEEWLPIPGSIEAIAALSNAGFKVCIATNQSGLARGYFSSETLTAMHVKMSDLVSQAGGTISYIEHCPHGPDNGCNCRKPLPGMINTILTKYPEVRAENVYVVGDSLRDLEAGVAAGCKPLLVKTGKGERTLTKGNLPEGTIICNDLSSAVNVIAA
ncbi:D-glycero-beta-D-manno-heptose 1,7-bisphosphate 7-phosphatase [Aliamphritea ceti]|uniref:D-glycero-beta-D-manno-heptose 1,7-bisphosphate 7-phosphatase n=1 Tax=Aliamphritea ceti TaxID=1524258 RepID=UPI0021C30B6E|nr:D-glycero-beta-D-manno-heptose 1,7-bisphosphate 7-phosphatase [Aliamphritea ceti]